MGVAVAALAAQHGFRVLVVRMSDEDRPRAETLRNQTWLQSGLMYMRRLPPDQALVVAKRMYVGGFGMLKDLELPPPPQDQHGILRVKTLAEGEELERDARALSIHERVQRLSESGARRALGRFYEEDSIYYSIPDMPFDEASVLSGLRSRACSANAFFCEVDAPVQLLPDRGDRAGFSVQIDGHPIVASATLLACGAGIVPALEQLEVKPPMTLRQTPLMVLHDLPAPSVPLFADREGGFSFVHQPAQPGAPNGATIFGTVVHREVEFQLPQDRRVSEEDVKKFSAHLPNWLAPSVNRGRFTAGYEVIPEPDTGMSYVEPWVSAVSPSQFPGLFFALPGRATTGLIASKMAFDKILPYLSRARWTQSAPDLSGFRAWEGDIYPHSHPRYGFNDADPRPGASA